MADESSFPLAETRIRFGRRMTAKPRRRTLVATMLAVTAFAVSLGLMLDHDRMGVTFEFAEYADIAREIARGNGFQSHVIYPSVLAHADRAGIGPSPTGTWPVMNRHPGFAYALAPFIAVFGPLDEAMWVALAFWFGVFILASYLVLSRLVGDGAAAVAALLLMLNPAFLRFFVPGGYAAFLFGALALTFLYRVTRAVGRDRPVWEFALLGLLGALCWTVRFNFSVFVAVAVLAVFLGRHGRRLSAAAALVAGYAMGVAPFEAWHYATFGTTQSPPSLWNLLDGFPGYASPWSQYRTFGLHDVLAGDNLRHLFLEKFPFYLAMAIRDLPVMLLYVGAFPFFVVALFTRRPEEADTRRFLMLASAVFAVMLVTMSLFRFENWTVPGSKHLSFRYYIWFAPVLVGYAVRGFIDISNGLGKAARVGAAAGVLAVQLAWFAMYWTPLAGVYEIDGRFDDLPVARAVRRIEEGGGLRRDLPLMTNMPAQVAWYLDRPAIMLAKEPSGIDALRQRHQVAGLLFTMLPVGEPGGHGAWFSMLSSAERQASFLRDQSMKIAYSDPMNLLLVPDDETTATPATP